MASPGFTRQGMRYKRPKINPLPTSVTKRAFNCIRSSGVKIDGIIQSTQPNNTPTIEHSARLLRLSEKELEKAFGIEIPNPVKRPRHASRNGHKSKIKQNEKLLLSRPAFDCTSPTHIRNTALSPVRGTKHSPTNRWDPRRAYGTPLIAQKGKRSDIKGRLGSKLNSDDADKNANVVYEREGSSEHSVESALQKVALEDLMLREGYMEEMKMTFRPLHVRKQYQANKLADTKQEEFEEEMLTLIQQLRTITVRAILSVKRWQNLFITPRPFIFKHQNEQPVNALLRIMQSMDFLQDCLQAKNVLGKSEFDSICNPLLLTKELASEYRYEGLGQINVPLTQDALVPPAEPIAAWPASSGETHSMVNVDAAIARAKAFIGIEGEDRVKETLRALQEEEVVFGTLVEGGVKLCRWCGDIPVVPVHGSQAFGTCCKCRTRYCESCVEINDTTIGFDIVKKAMDWVCPTCQDTIHEERLRRQRIQKQKQKMDQHRIEEFQKRKIESENIRKEALLQQTTGSNNHLGLNKDKNFKSLYDKQRDQTKRAKKRQRNQERIDAREALRKLGTNAKEHLVQQAAARDWLVSKARHAMKHVERQQKALQELQVMGQNALHQLIRTNLLNPQASSLDLFELDEILQQSRPSNTAEIIDSNGYIPNDIRTETLVFDKLAVKNRKIDRDSSEPREMFVKSKLLAHPIISRTMDGCRVMVKLHGEYPNSDLSSNLRVSMVDTRTGEAKVVLVDWFKLLELVDNHEGVGGVQQDQGKRIDIEHAILERPLKEFISHNINFGTIKTGNFIYPLKCVDTSRIEKAKVVRFGTLLGVGSGRVSDSGSNGYIARPHSGELISNSIFSVGQSSSAGDRCVRMLCEAINLPNGACRVVLWPVIASSCTETSTNISQIGTKTAKVSENCTKTPASFSAFKPGTLARLSCYVPQAFVVDTTGFAGVKSLVKCMFINGSSRVGVVLPGRDVYSNTNNNNNNNKHNTQLEQIGVQDQPTHISNETAEDFNNNISLHTTEANKWRIPLIDHQQSNYILHRGSCIASQIQAYATVIFGMSYSETPIVSKLELAVSWVDYSVVSKICISREALEMRGWKQGGNVDEVGSLVVKEYLRVVHSSIRNISTPPELVLDEFSIHERNKTEAENLLDGLIKVALQKQNESFPLKEIDDKSISVTSNSDSNFIMIEPNRTKLHEEAHGILIERGLHAKMVHAKRYEAQQWIRKRSQRFKTHLRRQKANREALARMGARAIKHVNAQVEAKQWLTEYARGAKDVARGVTTAEKLHEASTRKFELKTLEATLHSQAHTDRLKSVEAVTTKDQTKKVMMVKML